MAERFAFITGEEINLLVDKVVQKNLLLAFLMLFFILTQCSNTQACCEILHGFNYKFHSVQQSLN